MMYLYALALLFLSGLTAARLEAAGTDFLTPAQAVDQSLASHPAIPIARESVQAALGARQAAGQLPNPSVTYGFESLDRAGVETGEWSLDAQLPIDFIWRRGARGYAALARVAGAEANASLVRVELRLQVLSTFTDAFTAAGQALALSTAANTLEEVTRIGRARLQEGDLSDYDVRRMELESQRISRAVQLMRLREATARRQLALLMGADIDSLRELRLHAGYPLLPPADTPEVLVARALALRADLQVASAEQDATMAEVDRLVRQRWPGLQAGLGYKKERGGASGLTGTVSVDLPLFDRAQGQLQEARAIERRAALQVEWLRTQVAQEVKSLHANLTAWYEQLEALPDEDELTDLLNIARQTYDEGDSDLITLIDAVHSLTGETELRWTLLQDYQKTYYELERAIGMPLAEAAQRTDPE